MKNPILSFVLLITFNVLAEDPQIPDATVRVEFGTMKEPLWRVSLLAPKSHHFNLESPKSAKSPLKAVEFESTLQSERKLEFLKEDPSLAKGDTLEVSYYLCDDAKTFCHKKTQTHSLYPSNTQELNQYLAEEKRISLLEKTVSKNSQNKKVTQASPNSALFLTSIPLAIQKAHQKKQKLMIDFFGIWCPPCNLLDETVFNQKSFKKASEKFVLLKVDVDHPDSWDLKSHFQVGGYPTIVFAEIREGQEAELKNLKELKRVVGYRPLTEIVQILKAPLNESPQSLKAWVEQIENELEKKDYDAAQNSIEKASVKYAKSMEFELLKFKQQALSKKDQVVFKSKEFEAVLNKFQNKINSQSQQSIYLMLGLITSHADHFKNETLQWSLGLVDLLKKKVNPQTLHLSGMELSVADLESFKVSILEALKSPENELKSAYLTTAKAFENVMNKLNVKESRGLLIEKAYYLRKGGEFDQAIQIYKNQIAKFPEEFTYYYQAAVAFLDKKQISQALEYSKKALEFSYGDNQIRSAEVYMKSLVAQGSLKEAKEYGKKFVDQLKAPASDLKVRTGRYIDKFKKTWNEIKL